MIEEIVKELNEYLDERRATVLQEAEALKKDDRIDESNVLKAKANIYDIFKSLCKVSASSASNKEQFGQEFVKKSTVIPSAWEKSLENAKAHGDVEKILIEEAKLSAVYEIREKFNSLMN